MSSNNFFELDDSPPKKNIKRHLAIFVNFAGINPKLVTIMLEHVASRAKALGAISSAIHLKQTDSRELQFIDFKDDTDFCDSRVEKYFTKLQGLYHYIVVIGEMVQNGTSIISGIENLALLQANLAFLIDKYCYSELYLRVQICHSASLYLPGSLTNFTTSLVPSSANTHLSAPESFSVIAPNGAVADLKIAQMHFLQIIPFIKYALKNRWSNEVIFNYFNESSVISRRANEMFKRFYFMKNQIGLSFDSLDLKCIYPSKKTFEPILHLLNERRCLRETSTSPVSITAIS